MFLPQILCRCRAIKALPGFACDSRPGWASPAGSRFASALQSDSLRSPRRRALVGGKASEKDGAQPCAAGAGQNCMWLCARYKPLVGMPPVGISSARTRSMTPRASPRRPAAAGRGGVEEAFFLASFCCGALQIDASGSAASVQEKKKIAKSQAKSACKLGEL